MPSESVSSESLLEESFVDPCHTLNILFADGGGLVTSSPRWAAIKTVLSSMGILVLMIGVGGPEMALLFGWRLIMAFGFASPAVGCYYGSVGQAQSWKEQKGMRVVRPRRFVVSENWTVNSR